MAFLILSGLISLDSPTDSSCFVCFSNEEKKYSDKSCFTYVLTSSEMNPGNETTGSDFLLTTKKYLHNIRCSEHETRLHFQRCWIRSIVNFLKVLIEKLLIKYFWKMKVWIRELEMKWCSNRGNKWSHFRTPLSKQWFEFL